VDEIQFTEALEDCALSQRGMTREDEIIEEATKWVADLVNPRTRDTCYFRMVEVYCMVKDLVAQVVSATKRKHSELIHIIHILEGKFELLCLGSTCIKFLCESRERPKLAINMEEDKQSNLRPGSL
jgi:hypothetical protein